MTFQQLCFIAACLMLFSASCDSVATPLDTRSPSIQFHDCIIHGPRNIRSQKARCGTLSVPENRAQPHGQQIQLFVAVIPARAAHPAPDPLFFIAGGPGESAVDGFFSEPGAFAAIRKQRNIVLVDQRGTGRSNPLDCAALSQHVSPFRQPTATERRKRVAACLDQLSGNPRYYTTSVAIADLDAVRQALGAEQINLYGISYGTRVALEYLRYYGEHVRSVILDGVVPTDLVLGLHAARNAERALKAIFARCEALHRCAQKFPDIKNTFHQLNQRLRQHPAHLTIPDPITGVRKPVTLTQTGLAGGIRLLTYTSETASLLPLLIYKGAHGNLHPLAGLIRMINGDVSRAINQGMYLSVVCTEDVPFYPDTLPDAHGWAGQQDIAALKTACSVWPRGIMRPGFKKPVESNKAVLLLSGEDDPITPPSNAAHAAKTLPNSLSIVIDGQGHGNAFRGCLPRVMAAFVRTASVKQLDTSCVHRIHPAPFFLRFTGPAP